MANQEQLDLLQQGVAESWNRWRLVHLTAFSTSMKLI